MSLQEQFQLLVQSAVQEKDEEIKQLKEQNSKLREENERLLKQFGHGDVKNKAESLKKALEDFLEHPNSNRSAHYSRYQPPSVLIPNSGVDVKPSTSRPDEPSMNGSKYHHPRPNYSSNHEDFSSRQEFRLETDAEIINQANPTDQHHFHPNHSLSHTTVPTTFNGNNSQKRFHPNVNGYNANNNNGNRNNRNNNNNNSNKHTIFVSWPGTATKEQLHELFDSEGIEVADIRYTAQKQFAHVDLKNEQAVSKACLLNGVTKNEKQGQLRVEVGKPRSSNPNPTENGQRPQNQNKNYRQNNKNPNGYNTSSPQKQNKFNPNYSNNHHSNNHVTFPSFPTTTEEKDINSNWNSPDIPKSESN